jgi:hypothetical protein
MAVMSMERRKRGDKELMTMGRAKLTRVRQAPLGMGMMTCPHLADVTGVTLRYLENCSLFWSVYRIFTLTRKLKSLRGDQRSRFELYTMQCVSFKCHQFLTQCPHDKIFYCCS